MFENYKDKKVAVLGFGIEGIETYHSLIKNGIKPAILDKEEKESLITKNQQIDFSEIEIFGGVDYLNKLKDFDVVFKSPGISPLLPEIIEAKSSRTFFTSQIEEFFNYCPCPIIGITGTKGKGTTSTLIFEILKKAGKDVFLGGNIGIPAVGFIEKLNEKSLVVLELSSFQLQVLSKSPHISVVLNITSEHLDYHKDTEEYREAKKSIVKFQTKDDFAVINKDYDVPKSFEKETIAQVLYFSRKNKVEGCYVNEKDEIVLSFKNEETKLAKADELQLRGRHNLENIAAASLASYLAGADVSSVSKVIKSFKGLEHRLEFVREVNKVKYYNDSFSTVPETVIAAVQAFEEPKILILGGSDKGSDYTEMGKIIEKSNVKAVILIGEMAEKISKSIPVTYTGEKIFGLATMREMVIKATEIATEGDIVLLSPACASFGLFKNYKDRGNQFKEAVNELNE